MMIAFAIMALAAWWLIDQPRRRGKAIATTKRAGGFVQFDDQYDPERPVSPSAPTSLVGLSDKWFGPEYAHGVSVISFDGQPNQTDQQYGRPGSCTSSRAQGRA